MHQYLSKTLPSALSSAHPQMELHESHGNLFFSFIEKLPYYFLQLLQLTTLDSHFPNDNSDVENLCMGSFERLFEREMTFNPLPISY